jgi:hypothetical protein
LNAKLPCKNSTAHTYYENVALDLLTRKGTGVIWDLHLDAANAHRKGCPQSAEILIETADAAERIMRHGKAALTRDTK